MMGSRYRLVTVGFACARWTTGGARRQGLESRVTPAQSNSSLPNPCMERVKYFIMFLLFIYYISVKKVYISRNRENNNIDL